MPTVEVSFKILINEEKKKIYFMFTLKVLSEGNR